MKTKPNYFAASYAEIEDGGYINLWTNCIKQRLPPSDVFSIETNEIKSEIVNACIHLSNEFNPSIGIDFITFCNIYVIRRAARAIWEDIKRMQKHVQIVNDYEEVFSDYAVVENNLHDFVADSCTDNQQKDLSISGDDVYAAIDNKIDGKYTVAKWTAMYEAAFELDKNTDYTRNYAEIVDCLKMNMTDREIAYELDTNHMNIHRRIDEIVERAIELQK